MFEIWASKTWKKKDSLLKIRKKDKYAKVKVEKTKQDDEYLLQIMKNFIWLKEHFI